MAGAWLDSTPCLFLSGQVKRPDRMFAADGTPLGMRQLGVQEVDIVSIVSPSPSTPSPLSIRTASATTWKRLFTSRRNGRPGRSGSISRSTCRRPPSMKPTCRDSIPPKSRRAFDASAWLNRCETIDALNRSERPLIFIGNGVRLATRRRRVSALVVLAAPDSGGGYLVRGRYHFFRRPALVGRPGSLAARGANFALQNSDFLLSIGARLDFAITGYAPDSSPAPRTR